MDRELEQAELRMAQARTEVEAIDQFFHEDIARFSEETVWPALDAYTTAAMNVGRLRAYAEARDTLRLSAVITTVAIAAAVAGWVW